MLLSRLDRLLNPHVPLAGSRRAHRPLGVRLELAASVKDGDCERCWAAALHQLRDIMPVDPICDGLGHRPCQAETGQLAHPPGVHGARAARIDILS
jgi:hypothetical protein